MQGREYACFQVKHPVQTCSRSGALCSNMRGTNHCALAFSPADYVTATNNSLKLFFPHQYIYYPTQFVLSQHISTACCLFVV